MRLFLFSMSRRNMTIAIEIRDYTNKAKYYQKANY